ncbi:hypothetical protein AUC70_13970 [Methyloceanibacter stevinii]|uniref:GGDEF domain-containing protein n=1 Tax=Methyloceanibacter stevinii TaxID=1774970 RepID=A0A1E3VTM8_9HYPH|nr:diguanylate cyclase [Methyloceanibacter stevinii]ODR96883.1 hypothetical protein AUC70_13970 [Methyloceanibacter stevinii]
MALLNATPGEHPAVLVVHLNQLQNWHESLAPEDRERALLNIGRRIDGVLDRSDSLCRWTRNEFAILRTRTQSVDDAIKLAEKVQKALRAPIGDGDDAFFLTTSIGLATGFEAATTDSAEDVLGVASGAAARASNLGLGRIEIANLDDAPAA